MKQTTIQSSLPQAPAALSDSAAAELLKTNGFNEVDHDKAPML